MKQLKNSVTVEIIDRYGYKLDEQIWRNTPLAELYPKEKLVMIQWTAEGDNQRPTIEELQTPVEYNGRKYYGCYGWGSAVKRGVTLGLTNDFPSKKGPVKLVEDGQRVGRWLMAQGTFGGFTAEKLTIGIVPPGTIMGAGPVEDGFGYIKKSLIEKFARKERIELGAARENWTFFQRIPWEKVKDEFAPLITEACIDASDPEKMLWQSPHSAEQKKELYNANKEMIEHPFVAAALNRSAQDYFARLCTSVYLHGVYRTAVPTTCPTICWPGHSGKIEIDRSPIDSYGSIQAVNVKRDKAEEARISKMEVVQHSISSKEFSAKGCLGIVDDDLLDYDIVICSEDIKMAKDLKAARKASELTLENVVVPFLQIWSANSVVGVNAAWAKKRMGLDHDGDGVRLTDCKDLPSFWKAVKELPEGETPKLPKSKRPLADGDLRAEMIYKSMYNLVGFATNVAGATFMVSDREWLAKELGFKNEEALDNRLNYFIKAGTDGYKCDIDQEKIAAEIAVMQSNIRRMFGRTAPWTKWNGDEWAFKRALPYVIQKRLDDNRVFVGSADDPIHLSDRQAQLSVWPFMDGTVAEIARMALPQIEPHWSESVSIRPLTAFRCWAPFPDKNQAEQAKEVQFWFNARVTRVNWTDNKSIQSFKIALAERIEEWLATGISRKDAAYALWHQSHSSRGADASAASVFLAFPDECLEIVRSKPGEVVKEVVLTGLNHQIPNFKSGTLKDLRVADITTLKNGKKIVRRVLVGKAPGQVAPKDKALPANLIAFIAANCDQPDPGEYKIVTISQIGPASWLAKLV